MNTLTTKVSQKIAQKIEESKKKKYIVYKNDLKYRINRNLDKSRIEWDNDDVKRLFDTDLDTLDYRIQECVTNNYEVLDLEGLDLKQIPQLNDAIYTKLSFLSLANNKITELNNLGLFKNLKVLDCLNNQIEEINNLPDTLEELNCRSNKVKQLILPKNILRVDCAFNELSVIGFNNTTQLKSIICSHNKLTYIPDIQSIEKLICCYNIINKLGKYPSIEILDCRCNKLDAILEYKTLRELYCSSNDILSISSLPALVLLDIIDTKITKVPFSEKLKELTCNVDTVKISNKFNVGTIEQFKTNYYIFTFTPQSLKD